MRAADYNINRKVTGIMTFNAISLITHGLCFLLGSVFMFFAVLRARGEQDIPGVFGIYWRRCPKCGIKLKYKTRQAARNSAKADRLCRSCCNRSDAKYFRKRQSERRLNIRAMLDGYNTED